MPVLADIYYHLYDEGREEQGQPLVLIHGAGGNYLSWPTQIRRLPGYRVYALDLPGHGKSSGVGCQSIEEYAQKITGWLTELGSTKAVFAGHSMGSAIALHMALENPKNVQGVILIGSGASLRVNLALLDGIRNQTTYFSTLEKITAWSFSDQTPQRLVELAGARLAETRPGVLLGDFLACAAFNVTDRLDEISQPTLVICGEHDKMTPCRGGQYLADHLHEGQMKVIPNAGHMVMLEKPEEVAEEIQQFLQKSNHR